MIIIDRISNVKKDQVDETWAIVRSLKNGSSWIRQMTALSPSWDLFKRYNNIWKPSGNWNANTFNTQYVPTFLQQIAHDKWARMLIEELKRKDAEGKTIALVCFCTDEELCHRSIIAGILQGMGCNVVTRDNKDYSHFYTQFQNVR